MNKVVGLNPITLYQLQDDNMFDVNTYYFFNEMSFFQ